MITGTMPVAADASQALQCFLYLLMRDKLPTGKVEKIMEEIRAVRAQGLAINFSAPRLAEYAAELAFELLGYKNPIR